MPVYKFLLKWALVPLQIKEGLQFLQMRAGLGMLVWLLVLCAHFGSASRMAKHRKHLFFRHHLKEALLLCLEIWAAFLCSVRSLLEGSFWEPFLPSVCVKCSQEFWIYFLNSGSSVCSSSSVWNRSCSCSDMFQSISQVITNPPPVFEQFSFPFHSWSRSVGCIIQMSPDHWKLSYGSKVSLWLFYQCRGFCRSVLHGIDTEQEPELLGQPYRICGLWEICKRIWEGFFFPHWQVICALAWEETNEIEAGSGGSQMLEKFQSKHLNFLSFSVAVYLKHSCALCRRDCYEVLFSLLGSFFLFYLSAVRDKDLHSLQCVFSASACRECDNHSWAKVRAHGDAVYLGKVAHESQSNSPSSTKPY